MFVKWKKISSFDDITSKTTTECMFFLNVFSLIVPIDAQELEQNRLGYFLKDIAMKRKMIHAPPKDEKIPQN